MPEWYFLPFYAILRAIDFDFLWIVPAKLGGVILMFGSILVLLLLPWLDRSPVRSASFRPYYKWFFWVFVIDCVILGWVGSQPADGVVAGIPMVVLGQIGTLYYFGFFIVIMPLLAIFERPKRLPSSISEPVLKGGGVPAGAVARPMDKAR